MQSTGQTSTHASQPVQLSALTTAISLKNFLRGLAGVVTPGVGIEHLNEGLLSLFTYILRQAATMAKRLTGESLTGRARSRIIPAWTAQPEATPRGKNTTRAFGSGSCA